VNQNLVPESMNILDVTGYVQKGDNKLMLDFPFEAGQKAFAAKLIVEYFNTDQVEFVSNQSWLMKDDYTYPSYLIKGGDYKQAEIMNFPGMLTPPLKDHISYTFNLPDNYLANLNNLFMKINYSGDKAKLYFNHRLVADDFNNGTTWNIGLNRIGNSLENQSLKLEIFPLQDPSKIYFDNESTKKEGTVAKVKQIQLVPEYLFDFNISANGLEYIKQ
jgi:hypothetical protein